MSGASEMGSLTAHSNEESQFVGSSSGVYFVNTVRQAFSQNLNQSGSSSSSPSGQGCFPPPEDTLVGSEDSPRDKQHVDPSPSIVGDLFLSHWKYAPAVAAQLGDAPSVDVARELMMIYFRIWHPLFPFLHGPTFLQAMELLYAGDRGQDTMTAPNQPPLHDHRSACWTTILQCVFNLANLLRPDLHLPPESQIASPSSVYSLLGALSCRHDLSSLQALLAAQLYLVAKMSLRTASTMGSCILRSMLHAGLHRCPFRYKELSSHDRQLRKRIFWCAYAIDRYLSQALGLPLGIQDSDVDVCPPGASEVHVPGVLGPKSGKLSKTGNQNTPNSHSKDIEDQRKREAALASYVESGKLTGRALELFHKSILVRSIHQSSVLYLASDVHKWWNSLPRDLQSNPVSPSSSSSSSSTNINTNTNTNQPFNFGPFFTVLYHHLILLINRPFLSLAPSTPEFCSALQACIGAAREILAALSSQVEQGQPLFWPGFLSAAWMSGLVLAFACRLGQYVLGKGCR